MVIYSKNILKSIQNSIKEEKFSIKPLNSLRDINAIMVGEIKLKTYLIDDDKIDVMMDISNTEVNSVYIKEWKETAGGKFLSKDWKKNTVDKKGNCLYYKLEFIYNNKHMYALIRNLYEVNDITLDSEEKIKNYIKLYGDIIIDEKYYSLIKISMHSDNVFFGHPDKLEEKTCDDTLDTKMSFIEFEEELPTLDDLADKLSTNALF